MIFFILLMIICLFLFLNFLKKIGKGNLLLNVMLVVWMLVFIILIFFNSQSLSYFTEEGVIIIFGHLFMICFGVLFSPKMSFRFNKFPLNFTVGIGFLFYILLILSLIGLYLFSKSVNLIDAITSNQMAQLRANVLLKELEVSPMTVLLTNFLYPLAAITPIYTLYNKKRFLLLENSKKYCNFEPVTPSICAYDHYFQTISAGGYLSEPERAGKSRGGEPLRVAYHGFLPYGMRFSGYIGTKPPPTGLAQW